MQHFLVQNSGRLDAVLCAFLPHSRSQISEFVKTYGVFVGDTLIKKPSFAVKSGTCIAVCEEKFFATSEPQGSQNVKTKFDFNTALTPSVIFEDEEILVICKPSGLVTHAAASVKEATLTDWLQTQNYSLSTLAGNERYGIVHRLDKGTSGVMVVAKTNHAHAGLSEQLASKEAGRFYIAAIDLALKEACVVSRPIGRDEQNRLKKRALSGVQISQIVAKSGQNANLLKPNLNFANSANANPQDVLPRGFRRAKTAFLPLDLAPKSPECHFVAAKLFTGRTHQIRVHLASLNRHILGDDLYGFKRQNAKLTRIYLHAWLLKLTHPKSGEKMEFFAPFGEDFAALFADAKAAGELLKAGEGLFAGYQKWREFC